MLMSIKSPSFSKRNLVVSRCVGTLELVLFGTPNYTQDT
jgi:hypothetical protein